MRRLMTSVAVMLAMALLAPISPAQLSGTVSNSPQNMGTASSRPLGHAGVMPTPMGVSPPPARAFPTPTPIGVPPALPLPGTNRIGFDNGFHHHRHPHSDGLFGGAFPVFVPVPVVVDPSMYQEAPDPNSQDADDDNVAPGPTVFEHRTSAEAAADAGSIVPAPAEADSGSQAASPGPTAAGGDLSAAPPAAAGSQTTQPQEPSVLVFRDGHQLEIQNYAIVGQTLYDLAPGHTRRVPLSQLDLTATQKANDDRGVDFTLPASSDNE